MEIEADGGETLVVAAVGAACAATRPERRERPAALRTGGAADWAYRLGKTPARTGFLLRATCPL